MNTTANCELYHYGILGQRWGVRRSQAQLDRINPGSSRSSAGKTAKAKNDVKDMSNEELNAIIKRMELEKRYRDLNPKKVSAGKRFVNTAIDKAIVPVATEISKQMLKEYILKAKKK